MSKIARLLFVVFLVLNLSAYAQAESQRKRVGLVLSGGGARGAAHLGVIKMLEKNHIPIDAIVGTSMGAFVGGLYASGLSTQEIETLLESQPWRVIIGEEYAREDTPFRRKEKDRDFVSSVKLDINETNDMVLAPALFKKQGLLNFLKKQTYPVQAINNFDDLRIPYRAVACRLRDGKAIVLREGSLARSIYASVAIPGLLEPINIQGNELVDGKS